MSSSPSDWRWLLDSAGQVAHDRLVAVVATPAAQEWQLPATIRRALILAPPLVLAVYEIFHPRPDQTVEAVMDVAGWFTLFHVIQLFLIPFLILSIGLLAQDLGVLGHPATRVGLGLALAFFSAYDAMAGISTGLAMRAARDLPPAQQDAVFEIVDDWPGFDPLIFSIGIVAVVGLALALGMLTLGARRLRVGRGPVVLLAIATLFALGGHPFPFGTVAFGCLFLAALWLDRRGYGESAAEPNATENARHQTTTGP
jgi:hypothetical protein